MRYGFMTKEYIENLSKREETREDKDTEISGASDPDICRAERRGAKITLASRAAFMV